MNKVDKELQKFFKLIGLNELPENIQDKVSIELGSIIKENKFKDPKRYTNFLKLSKLDKLNKDTQHEVTSKLDNLLTEKGKQIKSSPKTTTGKGLHELYYPKGKEVVCENVINKKHFNWDTEYTRSKTQNKPVDNTRTVVINENLKVLESNTYEVDRGDSLTSFHIDYLTRKGFTIVERVTGD